MNHSIKTGVSFGLTSGVITTLGLMVGLNSGTHSRVAVLGGVLTIAIADALSDALGIHMSEESEGKHTQKEIWLTTFSTFISKFAIAISFIIPVLVFKLDLAVIISIIWGLILVSSLSYYIARFKHPWKVALEHAAITIIVVVVTHLVGLFISNMFI